MSPEETAEKRQAPPWKNIIALIYQDLFFAHFFISTV